MKKNTLVFILTEGIGLNRWWKGNYLKLANKPNINYLISGIYPWAIISNTKKPNKKKDNKYFEAVDRVIDNNFYQLLYGTTQIKSYSALLDEQIEKQTLHQLSIFQKLKDRAKKSGCNRVHLFVLFTNFKNKFYFKNLYYIINILIKNKLTPLIHLIADGQDEKIFNFQEHLKDFLIFLKRRFINIATISGKNHVCIKEGHKFQKVDHIKNYYDLVTGLWNDNTFNEPLEYVQENIVSKIFDADILPAANKNFANRSIAPNDAIMFLNADPDDFSSLLYLFKLDTKFKNLYITSLAPIYGSKIDALFFEDPKKDFSQNLLINKIGQNKNYNALVLSLNHKKGFIDKFFGKNEYQNVDRKIISTSFCLTDRDYYFNASKLLIDKTIESINKYDFIFVHVPTLAEAARKGNLKDLHFSIETFDKNLGRLLNLCKATGNIIAFSSPYGLMEKMVNKEFYITQYPKNSLVPFVYTNGLVSSKKVRANFINIYASILSTLELLDPKDEMAKYSLINQNFTKTKMQNTLNDAFDIWNKDVATPLIENFEKNSYSLYQDITKDKEFFAKKQRYIAFKEIWSVQKTFLLTPEARKKLFEKIYNYITYNYIDFFGFDIKYQQILETLFDDDIHLQKLSKWSNKYFDRRILNTNYKKNAKWVDKIKFSYVSRANKEFNILQNEKTFKRTYNNLLPFAFFVTLHETEIKMLKTNDALLINEFYDSIVEDVRKVYESYIGSKASFSDSEDKDDVQIAFENKIYNIHSYYEYFENVIEVINANKEHANEYNKKYQSVKSELKNQNLIKQYNNVFETPSYLLNKLVTKIVNVYQFYYLDIQNHLKAELRKIKTTINKYDKNYALKVNLAKNIIVYEGEFDEMVNVYNQNRYHKYFNEYVNLYKEFDVKVDPSLNFSSEPPPEEFIPDAEEFPDLKLVNKNISTKERHNRIKEWFSDQIIALKKLANIKENVAIAAEDEVQKIRALKNARKRIKKYKKLAANWKKTYALKKYKE